MKKLLPYLKDYKLECVLGPLFKLLEALLELFVPLVVVSIIDRGIPSGDRSFLLWRCLLLAGLGLVGFACSATAQYFAAKAAVGFSGRLRRALFAHIQQFSYAGLDAVGPDTLLTRMTSDMNQLQTGVNLGLRLLLRSPFVVFGAMAMAFTIDVPSALLFAAAIPLLAAAVFGIMLGCIPLYARVQEKLDGVLALTRENLTGVRVIRAFGREEAEDAAFRARGASLKAAQAKVGRLSALMNPLTAVLINLFIALLIYKGALRVNTGALTQGQVVALYNYMSQILVELIKLANLIINLTKAAACGKRISAVLELPAGEPADAALPEGDPACAVEFRNAAFRYPNAGGNAVEGVSLAVRPGETIGIIGGTGCGKTTLVNLIPRFYEATEGAVYVNGRDVRTIPAEELRSLIGVVPQRATLFTGTIRSNLLWGDPDADDAALQAALEAAQAADIAARKPEGLSAPVEQGGRNFSGGQRQRLTVARALVRKPPILILDDSSSALDFATDAALRRALRALPWRPAVLLVSQRISSVRQADRILVLDDGKVAGIGTDAELTQRCAVYREIAASQLKKEERA